MHRSGWCFCYHFLWLWNLGFFEVFDDSVWMDLNLTPLNKLDHVSIPCTRISVHQLTQHTNTQYLSTPGHVPLQQAIMINILTKAHTEKASCAIFGCRWLVQLFMWTEAWSILLMYFKSLVLATVNHEPVVLYSQIFVPQNLSKQHLLLLFLSSWHSAIMCQKHVLTCQYSVENRSKKCRQKSIRNASQLQKSKDFRSSESTSGVHHISYTPNKSIICWRKWRFQKQKLVIRWTEMKTGLEKNADPSQWISDSSF